MGSRFKDGAEQPGVEARTCLPWPSGPGWSGDPAGLEAAEYSRTLHCTVSVGSISSEWDDNGKYSYKDQKWG